MSTLCCWPCRSGKISCTLRVPFGAYAPGQTLRYSLLIENQSMTDMSGYTVEFMEHITFTAHSPRRKTRETHTTLAKQKHPDDKCRRLANRQFDGELVLPALPPDTEDQGIIRVRHSLNIEFSLEGCHNDKDISVPLVIGTIPIRESLEGINVHPPIEPTAPMLSDTDNKDDPPSYGDLSKFIFIFFNNKHDLELINFLGFSFRTSII